MRTVGENFRRIREAKQLRQEDLFRALGYKRASNVSILENSRRLPRPDLILRMASVLGCAPSDLLEDVVTPYDVLRRQRDHREGDADVTTNRPPFRRDAAIADRPERSGVERRSGLERRSGHDRRLAAAAATAAVKSAR